MYTFTLASGKTLKISDACAWKLDPEFSKHVEAGARSMLKGFNSALRTARKKGVPLGEVLRVN